MKNLDYRNLAALDAVVTHGNFEKAALALGVSQSAVSQRVKALEDAAGRLLVVRGQPAVPTGLGQRLIAHFQHVRLMENALEIELGQDATLPTIAVAADADSMAGWFGEACAAMLVSPKCRIDMRLNTDGGLSALREGSVFGCVSSAQDSVGGATATALGVMRYVLVATPAFARQWFPYGWTLEAAVSAPAVAHDSALHDDLLSRLFGLSGQFPHNKVPTACAQHDFIAAGRAYGLLPRLQARDMLDRRELTDLAPGEGVDVPLRWHAWNIQTPVTQLLSEQVIAHARRYLDQDRH